MRKLLLCLGALSLSACISVPTGTSAPVLAPATYSNQTKIDEQIVVTAELAYKSWRVAVEAGVSSGAIKGPTAAKVAALDNQIFAALQTTENAYTAANAANLQSALKNFNSILTTGYSTIGGK